jgi:hypothetical protein
MVFTAAAVCAQEQTDPFAFWKTNEPVRVGRGGSSAFDVRASTFDPDRCFLSHWHYTAPWGHSHCLAEYRLKRDRLGNILPLSDPESFAENRLWTTNFNAALAFNPKFLKAFDVIVETTGTVSLLAAAEQGRDDNEGSVELVSVTRTETNITGAVWKDMSGEHPAGDSLYQPEGIAVDRTRHRVMVVTDVENGNNGFRIYGYHPETLAATGTVFAATVVTNGDARQAIALADGTFLVRIGSAGLNQGIWKVDASAHLAIRILEREDIEEHGLPGANPGPIGDMVVWNNYLYLLQYDLEQTNAAGILAFEWDPVNRTVKDRTVDGLMKLDPLYQGAFGPSVEAHPGGMSITLKGELLISSYLWRDARPWAVAFNRVPEYKPTVLMIK